MSTNPTILHSKFDPKNVFFTALEENSRVTSQKIAYVRYKTGSSDVMLQIQTPKINLFTYGIPMLGQYYPDDKSRSFIKLPLDETVDELKNFCDKLVELDTIMQSQEMKRKIFGSDKIAETYNYQPIVREPENDMEEDGATFKPKYMKLKIDTDYNTGDVKTRIMVKEETGRKKLDDIKTITDLTKYVRYKSNIRMVVTINKLYATRAKVGDKKKYGLTFKILQIECEAPVNKAAQYDMDAFVDDEDDELKTTYQKLDFNTVNLDNDEDDDDAIEEVDVVINNKLLDKLNLDDDGSEEEQEKTKKKVVRKKRVQV